MDIERLELIKKIRAKEWTMGNGQCPECCGTEAGFNGHCPEFNEFSTGHKKGCSVAETLEYLGESVLYERDCKVVSSTCNNCGKDTSQMSIVEQMGHCPDCNNWLFTGTKVTYEEVK